MMHTREASCDHDWVNSEASEGSRPRPTLTCLMGSDGIYACCIQNNNNINMYTCTTDMHVCPCICMHGANEFGSMCVDGFMFGSFCMTGCVSQTASVSLLYGRCRSINNATLAEVKEACVSGGRVGGGGRRQYETKRLRRWASRVENVA